MRRHFADILSQHFSQLSMAVEDLEQIQAGLTIGSIFERSQPGLELEGPHKWNDGDLLSRMSPFQHFATRLCLNNFK